MHLIDNDNELYCIMYGDDANLFIDTFIMHLDLNNKETHS